MSRVNIVRANFLMALEEHLGDRPENITREQVTEFVAKNINTQGPLGKTIKHPYWLLSDEYISSNGEVNVPWNIIEEYQTKASEQSPNTQSNKA